MASNQASDVPKKSRVARGGNFGDRRARGKKPASAGTQMPNDEDDEDQCLICADKIVCAAVTPCNHTTCHKCTFRQRALYEKDVCLICRSENSKVIFTEHIAKTYDDFGAKDFAKFDSQYGIEFTQDYIYNETMELLSNKCVVCATKCTTFKDLGDHAKAEHNKFFCVICSKNKKAFIPELPLYTYKQMQKHQADGDETGFNGHPECKHCHGKRFYSIDELNVHVRDRHERCHICDQYSPKTADYYRNYDALYAHFKRDHYVCTVPLCVEKRFVVFREELDMTAHMLKEHGGLSNGARIVIGSNTRHFHSSLSTFESSSARRSAIIGEEEEDHNSMDVKKKRFEERAKHYLNYKSDMFSQFTSINASYRSKRIDARDLLNAYKELFLHQTTEELSLLLSEYLEFFPQSSDLHKSLEPVVKELQAKLESEQFPVLGNGSGNAFKTNSWVNSRNANGSQERFPALKPGSKPTKTKQAAPIRYTVLKKKQPVAAPKVNVSQASSAYRPTYLDNLNKNSNQPVLGSSSPNTSKNTSPNTSTANSRTNSLTSSRNNSSSNLPESKFPALEKKSKKIIIPRVNPVNIADPNQWGKASESENESPTGELDIPITDKRKQKLMKKQNRLLFTNGIN